MAQRLLLNIRSNFEKRQAGGPLASDETDSFRMSTLVCDDLGATEAGERRASNVGLETYVSGTTVVGGMSMHTINCGPSGSSCHSPISPTSREGLE